MLYVLHLILIYCIPCTPKYQTNIIINKMTKMTAVNVSAHKYW